MILNTEMEGNDFEKKNYPIDCLGPNNSYVKTQSSIDAGMITFCVTEGDIFVMVYAPADAA